MSHFKYLCGNTQNSDFLVLSKRQKSIGAYSQQHFMLIFHLYIKFNSLCVSLLLAWSIHALHYYGSAFLLGTLFLLNFLAIPLQLHYAGRIIFALKYEVIILLLKKKKLVPTLVTQHV